MSRACFQSVLLAGCVTTGEERYQPVRPGGAQDPEKGSERSTAWVKSSSRALPGRVDHGHSFPVISSPEMSFVPPGQNGLRYAPFYAKTCFACA